MYTAKSLQAEVLSRRKNNLTSLNIVVNRDGREVVGYIWPSGRDASVAVIGPRCSWETRGIFWSKLATLLNEGEHFTFVNYGRCADPND